MGGVYWAYPLDFAPQTKAPKGYKPFLYQHYGRHGSRYLIGDRDYKWLVDLFEEAHRACAYRFGRRYLPAFAQVWEGRKDMAGI